MRLPKRKALVTGGAQGIGAGLALRLAQEGCDVSILDINLQQALHTANSIQEKTNQKILAFQTDVTQEESLAKSIKNSIDNLEGLDIVICNAGVLKSHFITEFPKSDWDFILNVNLTGTFLTIKHASQYMIEQKKGNIIAISSRSGKRGGLWNHAYCASKFAVIGLIQCVALDLAPLGIRANAICPGNALDTPLWKDLAVQFAKKYQETPEEVLERYRRRVPLGRGCDINDIASLMIFLCSDESSYMTGQAINLTGGEIMMP